MKQTQEKWEVHPSASESTAGITIITIDGNSVAEVYGSDIEAQEIANLFASAPEMLEELKHINEECIKMNRGDYDKTPEKINYVFSGIWKKAEKAINKAEGK